MTTTIETERFTRIAEQVGVTPQQVEEVARHLGEIRAQQDAFDTHVASLLEDGYRRGAPAEMDLDALAIEVQACRIAQCEECGHMGLEYHPFYRRVPQSRRPIALCPVCGHWDEI